MTPNKWAIHYLSEILSLSDDGIVKNLKFKSLGEFSLFCYLLKRDNLLSQEYLDVIQNITSKEYEGYEGKKVINGLICYCLETKLPFDKEEKSKEFNSVEELYFTSIFHHIECDKCWDRQIVEFIDLIQNQGLSSESLYFLTHLVFYSSDFGGNIYWTKFNGKIVSVILDVTKAGIVSCKKSKNWDLLFELYLSLIFISREQALNLKAEIYSLLKYNKSKFGWYLSDGSNLKSYEKNFKQLKINHAYSLFHTTLIAELLLKELEFNFVGLL
jgi:hypothetical protein